MIFALGLGWFPPKAAMLSGFSYWEIVLPVLTLVIYDFGYVARMTRASMAEVMTSQYIRTAVLKDRQLYIQAGGGVVWDSDPEAEWEETVNKSNALRKAAEEAGRFSGGGSTRSRGASGNGSLSAGPC